MVQVHLGPPSKLPGQAQASDPRYDSQEACLLLRARCVPDRPPENHFVFDHTKWIFYAADCYTLLGDDVPAEERVHEIIASYPAQPRARGCPPTNFLSCRN